MKTINPDTYTQTKKLICHWFDKKKFLIHYRMLKFYVRHGMIVDKVHNIISFKQSKCSENYTSFNTKKRKKFIKDFEKDFHKVLKNAFYGKTMENNRKRLKTNFIKKMILEN